MTDALVDETTVTVVEHWIVTGEPGPISGLPELNHLRYPTYRFVWSSADPRWLGEKAELEARHFATTAAPSRPGMPPWEDGPHLHHRTVTYSPLDPVP